MDAVPTPILFVFNRKSDLRTQKLHLGLSLKLWAGVNASSWFPFETALGS